MSHFIASPTLSPFLGVGRDLVYLTLRDEDECLFIMVLTNNFYQLAQRKCLIAVQLRLEILVLDVRNRTISHLVVSFTLIIAVFGQFLQSCDEIVYSFSSSWLCREKRLSSHRSIFPYLEMILQAIHSFLVVFRFASCSGGN